MATPVDAKLLKKTKFPPEFSRKVDMTKVNIEVMKKWIAGRISEILGNEDDVVIELCFNLLEGSRYPDIKSLQIHLTGFLDKDTAKFCKELWSLCLSGQENPQGVPKELLEAKKLELIQEKIEAEKAAEAARQQKEQERTRDREMDDIRRRERGERSERGRGGRNRYDRRRSRSPPPRYRSRDRYHREAPSRRDFDSYVPSSNKSRRQSRSPSRSSSRPPSRSPRRYRRRTYSRSRTPEGHDRSRQRRRPYSRSRSPDHPDRKEKRPSSDHGDRDRSVTRNRASRSRTPRRDRNRRRSSSRSVTPPRHDQRQRPSSHSRSRSRSHSGSRGMSGGIRRDYDTRRLSRSRNREHHDRRRRTPNRSPREERTRKRSLERYNLGSHRRRESSVSVPEEKRQKLADEYEKKDTGSEQPAQPLPAPVDEPATAADETTNPDDKKMEHSPQVGH
ncbi:uncharacterized protein N7482_009872 [Penicillium canariense]|uniref:PWI domain-containing protein n=1 Tax=Penicillium canariense TaxID=189055 RepID=A0A9W9HR76_9EURO|nr:uncharacterized protein N7482_009872 [Penicillium canariense]KAJ5153394.1 hypothetical protein N7482_009872 [Penicillium canariense]